jgi:hypothetical protein
MLTGSISFIEISQVKFLGLPSVFSTERLDFVGKPIILGAGLELMPPEIIYINCNLLDTQTLQGFTNDEQITLKRLKAEKNSY